MTREEAKQAKPYTELPNGTHFSRHSFQLLIDKIYDDFEARTCESCRYSNIEPYIEEYGECEKGYGWYWNSHMEIGKDFGCNKWEAKDDSLD